MGSRFSERHGYAPARTKLQVGSIDKTLRNRLWNVVEPFVTSHMRDDFLGNQRPDSALDAFWDEFFKLPHSEMPNEATEFVHFVNNYFFRAPWYEVYDMVEAVARLAVSLPMYATKANSVLEAEAAGYRMINGMITPIVEPEELEAIDAAMAAPSSRARQHVAQALAFLSDRTAPDHPNSIKESISAVEAAAREYTGDADATLGDALKKLKRDHGLHPALERAFSALYGYTSDAGGIRHALKDHQPPDFHDAKFMLLACSAFINYLAGRAAK